MLEVLEMVDGQLTAGQEIVLSIGRRLARAASAAAADAAAAQA